MTIEIFKKCMTLKSSFFRLEKVKTLVEISTVLHLVTYLMRLVALKR